MGKNIDKKISKNVRSEYSQNLFDHAKQSATDALETASKRKIQKAAEATGDLIRNKIADEISRVSKTSPQNNSETKKQIKKKYLEKDIYLQNKDRKLLMI